MAYETKVILTLLAHQLVKSKSVEEAYKAVEAAANTEGLNLPSFEELSKEYEAAQTKK